MLHRILFVLLLCLSMMSDTFAEGLKHLAVLEFRGVGLNAQIVLNLSDQTRRAATELLSKDEYLILTRETMMEILSDMGKDATCLDGMCELEVGRNIQADIIVTGDIVQYGDTYVLTLKLYSTVSGALLHTVEVQEKDLLALKNKTFSESKVLFQKGLGLSGGSGGAVNIQSGFTGSVQNDDWDVSSGNTAIVAFSSSPSGAVVLVDGQLLCTETPCSKEIKAGSHKVVFQKERYFPYQSTINAQTGAKISGDLKARFGHVSVSSSPSGVKVLMDGERFGSTPISRTEVDAGVHTLSIEDPCYVGQDYRFQMKPGGEEDVTYPVTERQSAVKVTVTDKENVLLGDVYVDGQKVGQSSSVIKVPLCSKEVKVKVNDRTFTEKLTLQERQISEISVDASGPGPVELLLDAFKADFGYGMWMPQEMTAKIYQKACNKGEKLACEYSKWHQSHLWSTLEEELTYGMQTPDKKLLPTIKYEEAFSIGQTFCNQGNDYGCLLVLITSRYAYDFSSLNERIRFVDTSGAQRLCEGNSIFWACDRYFLSLDDSNADDVKERRTRHANKSCRAGDYYACFVLLDNSNDVEFFNKLFNNGKASEIYTNSDALTLYLIFRDLEMGSPTDLSFAKQHLNTRTSKWNWTVGDSFLLEFMIGNKDGEGPVPQDVLEQLDVPEAVAQNREAFALRATENQDLACSSGQIEGNVLMFILTLPLLMRRRRRM